MADRPPQPADERGRGNVPEHSDVRRERSDASFRAIGIAVLVVLLLLGLQQFSVMRLFRREQREQATAKASPYPLAPTPSTALPAKPRLEPLDRIEGIESENVYRREADKERVLNSYGPAEPGYVHVPIRRAIELLADELPARQPPGTGAASESDPPKDEGLLDWGEPNSGRRYRRPAQ